jgi:hypothetical protein
VPAQPTFLLPDIVSPAGPPEVRPRTSRAAGINLPELITAAGIVVAIFVGIPILLRDTPSGWIIDIPIAVIAAAFAVRSGAVGYYLFAGNERVGLTGGFFYRVNAFGLRRRWPLKDLVEVVRVKAFLRVVPPGYAQPVAGIVDVDLIVNKRGRAVASFTSFWPTFVWPREAMTRLWQGAELPIREPWSKSVGVREIRQRYPGALPGLHEDSEDSLVRKLYRDREIQKILFAGIGCFLAGIIVLVLGFMAWLFGWSFSAR